MNDQKAAPSLPSYLRDDYLQELKSISIRAAFLRRQLGVYQGRDCTICSRRLENAGSPYRPANGLRVVSQEDTAG